MKKITRSKLSFVFLIGLLLSTTFDAFSQSFRLKFDSTGSSQPELQSNLDQTLPLKAEFDFFRNIDGRDFVAPTAGVYHFDVQFNFYFILTSGEVEEGDEWIPVQSHTEYAHWHLTLLNGNDVVEQSYLTNSRTLLSPQHSLAISTTIVLRKGDRISVRFFSDAYEGKVVNPVSASFSGFKVSDAAMTPYRPLPAKKLQQAQVKKTQIK